jgi:hypothetical protein
MLQLLKHWWILSLRGLLAFALALCIAFVPEVLENLILQVFAVPFTIATLAFYVVDSVLVLALSRQFMRGSKVRSVLVAQAVTSLVIAVGLVTIFFERSTLQLFVLLTAAQAAATGSYELIAASHLKRHFRDAEPTLVAGLISLCFSAALLFLVNGEIARALDWIVFYAFFFGATMLWFSLRVRAVANKWTPHNLQTAA